MGYNNYLVSSLTSRNFVRKRNPPVTVKSKCKHFMCMLWYPWTGYERPAGPRPASHMTLSYRGRQLFNLDSFSQISSLFRFDSLIQQWIHKKSCYNIDFTYAYTLARNNTCFTKTVLLYVRETVCLLSALIRICSQKEGRAWTPLLAHSILLKQKSLQMILSDDEEKVDCPTKVAKILCCCFVEDTGRDSSFIRIR